MDSSINVRSTNLNNIKVGELKAKFSVAGDRILRYYIDFRHTVLDLHKEVSAPEISILQNKVDTLMATWDKKFEAHQMKASLFACKELAEKMMVEVEERRNRLRNILNHTLQVDDAVDWEVLKDHSKFKQEAFPEPRPEGPPKVTAPQPPKISFFQKLLGQRTRIENEFREGRESYEKRAKQLDEQVKKKEEEWHTRMNEWGAQQARQEREFKDRQAATNAQVDELRTAWGEGSNQAILEHASIVLDASEYDDLISKEFQLQHEADDKALLVDYLLPSPDDLPATKSVRFVASTGELKETQIAAKDKKALFDDICYQVCLRTIHEIFEADTPEHIQRMLFNGSTNYIDKATGQEVHATILSLMVSREEFCAVNLARIEPKACFKSLKGVSAASLIGLSPIAPIMELDKDDKRFVGAQTVDLDTDGSTNLASMDWEEFEHLVREVFDKEFASRGGEVKVTQSSSDGGVDAIAFDPDPISGGKIIIQAKRYTKTVGVAAVRDLYGTIMNEGANKGILVTTADYGPDAYKFASDKPLTLMTGANLLHLLSKHGIKAKIDLRGARKELGLRDE